MSTRGKPIVAITMAEASGIGPEILMKAINERLILTTAARCSSVTTRS